MNWKNVQLIFLREVRDQLRDRRTLFMVTVLPLLLYPALGLGMVYMKSLFAEQLRTVAVLGADQLPEFCKDCGENGARSRIPSLLNAEEGQFLSEYFQSPSTAERLKVVTDLDSTAGSEANKTGELFAQSAEIHEMLRIRESLDKHGAEFKRINDRLSRLMADAGVQVLVVVPEGFGKRLENVNRKLAEGVAKAKARDMLESPRLVVLRNSADEKSRIAYRGTIEALAGWEQAVLRERLDRAKLPAKLATPIAAHTIEVAEKSQIAAGIWSKLFPALLVMMAVTGAFYPAVDVGAGEKERGTMETLLICPASRTEIVMGKFLTVAAFSIVTALLNLLCMGLTGKYALSTLTASGQIPAPGFAAIFWIVVLLIPLAAMFSALSLAIATFARSSKEGQYYLTPLLMVTMGVTFFCLSPGVEIQPLHSMLPIMGPTLLLKELLSSSGSGSATVYLLPVLVTSFGYSLLALWWAVEQFSREDILFREAERFNPRLWLRHLLRDKEPAPSFAQAGVCFVLIMLLQFAAMPIMRDLIPAAGTENRGSVMVQLVIAQQLAIIATPALLMGIILTSNPRQTLRLNWPSWTWLGIALVLALVLHPLTFELAATLEKWKFFPALPKGVQEQVALMSDPDRPLWFVLLAFSLAPAVCEEVAFRGFILSGFNRRNRVWLAIGLSAAAFGLMHMIPQQVFNAALLGLVLGLLAVRSNSLLPGILFHLTYNALSVGNGRIAKSPPEFLHEAPLSWLFDASGGQLRYEWPTLIACLVVAAVVLRKAIGRPDVNALSPAGVESFADSQVAAKQ
jgi:sodium transport system permease protein